MQDVTNRYLKNILKDNNAYKTKLFSSLSHELRTPLNGALVPIENCVYNEPSIPYEIIDGPLF